MRATGYPGYRAHRAEHERFLRELLSLSGERVRRGSPGLRSEAVSTWLRRWLVAHLGTHDAALSEFLFQRTAPSARAEARAAESCITDTTVMGKATRTCTANLGMPDATFREFCETGK